MVEQGVCRASDSCGDDDADDDEVDRRHDALSVVVGWEPRSRVVSSFRTAGTGPVSDLISGLVDCDVSDMAREIETDMRDWHCDCAMRSRRGKNSWSDGVSLLHMDLKSVIGRAATEAEVRMLTRVVKATLAAAADRSWLDWQ